MWGARGKEAHLMAYECGSKMGNLFRIENFPRRTQVRAKCPPVFGDGLGESGHIVLICESGIPPACTVLGALPILSLS